MQKISSAELARVIGTAQRVIDTEIVRVVTDSRQVRKGDLFVAIRGEKFDGHQFAAKAIEQGAGLVMVEEAVAGIPAERQLVVENCLHAYGLIGQWNRKQFKGTVIGLTGSAGKTTTKEELKFALSNYGKVYATTGNHNNQVGVPFTLCNMDMSADFAVIEMGMSAKGEIAELVSFVQPDVAVVTNVYPMHIEFFPNFEGIAEAKAEIFSGLKKGGTAVINEDTNFADLLERRAKENGARVVKFGRQDHSAAPFSLSTEGEHFLYNAWCVLAVVEALGLDPAAAAARLHEFGALDGRGKIHQIHFGSGCFRLIDESYSGQPEAMLMAIATLDKMNNAGRKIAVLGKMAELGDTSQARHIEVGKTLAESSVDVVIGVCPEMKDMLAQLPASKEKYYFENKDGLDDFLLNKLLQNNDIVLIKGSHYSTRLFEVAESLLKQGEKHA